MGMTDEMIIRNHCLNIKNISEALQLDPDEYIVEVGLDFPTKEEGYVRFVTHKVTKTRNQNPKTEEAVQ